MLRACLRGANAAARVSLLPAPQPRANVSVLSFSDPEPASRCHSEFTLRCCRALYLMPCNWLWTLSEQRSMLMLAEFLPVTDG